MITPWTSAAMKTVVVSRSRVGAIPSRSCIARDISALLRAYAALECGNYHIADIEPELRVEFTDSCRTRDVDLGHVSTDHVDTDEDHSFLGEYRADLRGQPAIAFVEFTTHALGSCSKVPAVVRGQRNAGECVGDRLAVDQQ